MKKSNTVVEAKSIFQRINGHDVDYTREIKSIYRELVFKCHPDLGGSEEDMKSLNWARDVLESLEIAHSGSESHEERLRKWTQEDEENKIRHAALAQIIENLISSASAAYMSHFTIYFPEVAEYKSSKSVNSSSAHSYLTWASLDNKTIIKLSIYASHRADNALSTVAGLEDSVSISFTTMLYHNGRVYKIGQRSWKGGRLSGELRTPESIFPGKALKKMAQETRKAKPMARRDFLAALDFELEARDLSSSKDITKMIPISENRFLGVSRLSFLGKPYYTANIFFQKGCTYSPKGHITGGFEETDEGLEELRQRLTELKKMSA